MLSWTNGGIAFSFALDTSENPHIIRSMAPGLAYSNVIYYNDTYHYERMNRQGIDGDCYSPSAIALDANDNPHVAYFNKDGALCYASIVGGEWNTQTADPNCRFSRDQNDELVFLVLSPFLLPLIPKQSSYCLF
jgi:hypothetical protein